MSAYDVFFVQSRRRQCFSWDCRCS